MAFPIGPYTDGQSHTENGVEYIYSALRAAWDKAPPAVVASNFDQMIYDPVLRELQIGYSEDATPTLVTDMSALAAPIIDNSNGTYTQSADGVVIDTTMSVPALPAAADYDAQVVECEGLFFKWFMTPGTWVQVG